VRKTKALTVTMQTVTLFGKGRQNLTKCMYYTYEINSKTYYVLNRHLISARSSCTQYSTPESSRHGYRHLSETHLG
jgi:hypothetical protein